MKKNRKFDGKFITFEGSEGAGKSTQLKLLEKYLTAKGHCVVTTREPGGTPLAEDLRKILKQKLDNEKMHPETELLLIEAARFQHVAEYIIPALQAGKIVLCDRFSDSTLAYQCTARGLAEETVKQLNDFATQLCTPDLTILLMIDPEEGFKRTSKRVNTMGQYDRFETENLDFYRNVNKAFEKIASTDKERVKLLDASCSKEDITNQIRKIVDELI